MIEEEAGSERGEASVENGARTDGGGEGKAISTGSNVGGTYQLLDAHGARDSSLASRRGGEGERGEKRSGKVSN